MWIEQYIVKSVGKSFKSLTCCEGVFLLGVLLVEVGGRRRGRREGEGGGPRRRGEIQLGHRAVFDRRLVCAARRAV